MSLLSNIEVALLSSLIAGKKSTVGTERAVNCHGKSFSAASMVKNLISVDLYSPSDIAALSLKKRSHKVIPLRFCFAKYNFLANEVTN